MDKTTGTTRNLGKIVRMQLFSIQSYGKVLHLLNQTKFKHMQNFPMSHRKKVASILFFRDLFWCPYLYCYWHCLMNQWHCNNMVRTVPRRLQSLLTNVLLYQNIDTSIGSSNSLMPLLTLWTLMIYMATWL